MPYSFPNILNESGTVNLKSDSTASIEYIIPFADLSSAIASALLPVQHYRHSGLICQAVQYEPFGKVSASGNWIKAKLSLSFAPREDEEEEGPNDLGEINIGITGQTVSLPKKHYTLAEGGSSGQESGDKLDGLPTPSKILPEANMSIKVNNATQLDVSAVFGLIGKVNSGAWQGIHAKGGLFLGADSNRVIRDDGTETFTKSFNFSVKPSGVTWQKIWNPLQSSYITINPDLYETGDFNDLF